MTARETSRAYEPVIVFRYHDHHDIVKQRVLWLRSLNPGVSVHGLYGGARPAPSAVTDLFDSHFALELMPELAFRNVDLALIEWFRSVGQELAFSHAFICEWDLVYAAPLARIMPLPKIGQSLLTGYTPLSKVEWKWDWTNGKRLGSLSEWLELKRFVADKHGYIGPYYASIGPGAVLSRAFFDCYSRLELPLLCHDGLRLPLIHAIGDLLVDDTGLYPPNWYQPEHEAWIRRFNVRQWAVDPKTVASGIRLGHTAFHPVRNLLDGRLLQRVRTRYNM